MAVALTTTTGLAVNAKAWTSFYTDGMPHLTLTAAGSDIVRYRCAYCRTHYEGDAGVLVGPCARRDTRYALHLNGAARNLSVPANVGVGGGILRAAGLPVRSFQPAGFLDD